MQLDKYTKNIIFGIYRNVSKCASMLKEIKQNERIKFMDFAPEEKILDIYDSFDILYPPAYIRVFWPINFRSPTAWLASGNL